MRIYFSGIGGVAIGPLAEIAADAGYETLGSDLHESPLTEALTERGVHVTIGQDGTEIAAAHAEKPIDWFVYTSALPDDHPELTFARARGIRASKRDELLAEIMRDKDLQLIAVAGTHGKTTTTGMLVWCFRELGIPLSYSVGTTLSWGPSGRYDPESRYFVYECDEYDRNFLHFSPALSLITALDHDHFETYPTIEDYRAAFVQFIEQSDHTLLWERDLHYLERPDIAAEYEAFDELMDLSHLRLAGDHNRHNAFLVEQAMKRLFPDRNAAVALNTFPGTSRRFEKLAENLYTDYGHHPTEIAATLQLARELNNHVTLVYQPHQNRRQHELRGEYRDAFGAAETVYWLPTYLSREDDSQATLTPEELIRGISHPNIHTAEMSDELWQTITAAREAGKLVLVMGAGDIDGWARTSLQTK